MLNCGAAAALLIQGHMTKLKIVCDEESSISLQNVKKPAQEHTFIRSYRVANCSFTKNKTPSQVYFHGLQ